MLDRLLKSMKFPIKTVRNAVLFQAIRVYIALLNLLPRSFSLFISGTMGIIVYRLATETRTRTLSHLRLAYGQEKSRSEIRQLGQNVFRELGRNVVDLVRMDSITADNIDALVKTEGIEHLEKAYGDGYGVVAVSAHIGNFELMGVYRALKGFTVTVVAAPLFDARLDQLLREHRIKGGLHVVYRDEAAPAALRALRKGHIVGILADQHTRGASVLAPFFGHPVSTSSGPAILADRAGAPILPMCIYRQVDDTHRITISPPLQSCGRSPDKISETTRAYTAELERFIRRVPSQWVWMHDRWKTVRECGK